MNKIKINAIYYWLDNDIINIEKSNVKKPDTLNKESKI